MKLWTQFHLHKYAKNLSAYLSPRFFKKAMGILLTPPSVHPSVCPSRYLLLNQWAKYYQNCYITSPQVSVCESNISFLCVRSCVCRPAICLSHYLLLNHWAEFNHNCYIISSHGKVVREQHYCSSGNISFLYVRPSGRRPSICPSCYLLLKNWAEFNQTCYFTFPHGKSVW